MKRVLASLLLICSLIYAAEHPKKQSSADCVESLQNEVIGIIYSNSIKKDTSVEALTEKINKTFEKDCDINTTDEKTQKKARLTAEEEKNATHEYILILDTTKGGEACIETLQNEIAKIVHSDSDKKGKEKAVKLIIKGDSANCTPESEKK